MCVDVSRPPCPSCLCDPKRSQWEGADRIGRTQSQSRPTSVPGAGRRTMDPYCTSGPVLCHRRRFGLCFGVVKQLQRERTVADADPLRHVILSLVTTAADAVVANLHIPQGAVDARAVKVIPGREVAPLLQARAARVHVSPRGSGGSSRGGGDGGGGGGSGGGGGGGGGGQGGTWWRWRRWRWPRWRWWR